VRNIVAPSLFILNVTIVVTQWSITRSNFYIARAGATMAYHKGRGIQFGGVHDVEESEEGINSEFFNALFTWNIERNRYFPLSLRKPRTTQRKPQANDRGGRRGRGQANEDELLRNLAALETGKSLADIDRMEIDKIEDDDIDALPAKEILMEYPHPRFNAQLAIQGDRLFIYGGRLCSKSPERWNPPSCILRPLY
jgi:hypothetical protein